MLYQNKISFLVCRWQNTNKKN